MIAYPASKVVGPSKDDEPGLIEEVRDQAVTLDELIERSRVQKRIPAWLRPTKQEIADIVALE